MSNIANDRRIDYIEFPARDISAIKKFYQQVFGWRFTDFGPEYTSFHDGRLAGGFWSGEGHGGGEMAKPVSAALVVLYSSNLADTQKKVRDSGGKIVKDIFEFPGGRRFHFTDPSGNELAVWSE